MRRPFGIAARRTLALTILAITCCAVPARAQAIISNLNGNDNDATTLVGNLDRSKALGFTMPSSVPYQLDSVVMRLAVSDVTRTIAVELYGSAGGVPSGPALDSFIVPAFTANVIQNYTLLPSAPFVLMPSTTYFLVAYGTNAGSSSNYIDWMASFPPSLPTGVATYAGAFSDNSGAVLVPPTNVSSTVNSFAINATAVPEVSPAAMASILASAAALASLAKARATTRNCH